jgi:imidazolonepropionase-like amidohydrolase
MNIAARNQLALMAVLAGACSPSPEPPTLVISDVTIVDLSRGTVVPGRSVLIRGTRIVGIDSGPFTPGEGSTQIVDGRGKFLLPGLWDMHVHLGADTTDANRLLGWGITGARDMGGDLDQSVGLRDAIDSGRIRGPRMVIAGLALRGPAGSNDSGPEVVRSPLEAEAVIQRLASREVDFIKLHENLEPDVWFTLARAARQRGLTVAAHVPANLTPEQVADSGAHSIEHLEFIPDRCLGIFAAAQGSVPAGCSSRDLELLFARLSQDSVWLDPTLGSFRIWAPAQWPMIQRGFRDILPLIRAAGIRLLAGTDVGDSRFVRGQSLHDELALLVEAGVPVLEALRAATFNPARFLGLADSLGLVAPGFVADLLLLDQNPLADIRATTAIQGAVRGGEYLPRTVLDSLRR